MKTFGQLVKKSEITPEAYEIDLEIADSEFGFKSGQYVGVTPLNSLRPLKVPTKIFSITSSPTELPKMSLAFINTNSDFKQSLLVSNGFEIEGPYGDFTLPVKLGRLCFIAGGIGIAPFMSMVRSGLSEQTSLFYANHSQENIPYLEELNENENINLIKHFGKITEEAILNNLKLPEFDKFYIAGSLGMVLAAEKILIDNDVPKLKIKTEEFLGLE